jgi:hypothetical protein
MTHEESHAITAIKDIIAGSVRGGVQVRNEAIAVAACISG